MSQEILDLEAELDAMIAAEAGDNVVETILEQAGELTLGDLRVLSVRMPEAGEVTLDQLFSAFKTKNGLVSK